MWSRGFITVLFMSSLGGCFEAHERIPAGATALRAFCPDEPDGLCTSDPDANDPSEGAQRDCYFAAHEPGTEPVAEALYRFETTGLGDAIRVTLILSPRFVDNTYGARSSVGYRMDESKPHTFRDLERSDHAQFALLDGSGAVAYEVKLDYISEASDAESGYRSLGIWGGDGEMIEGGPSAVLTATSSLDDNLNLRGCVFTEDSPAPEACSDWEPRVIYAVWLATEAFGSAGFGRPALDHIHASPSRMEDTLEITRAPCPD